MKPYESNERCDCYANLSRETVFEFFGIATCEIPFNERFVERNENTTIEVEHDGNGHFTVTVWK